MSIPLSFDKTNALKVIKVFGFTTGSSLVALLANLVPYIHSTNPIVILAEAIFVNNIAVALLQWLGSQEKAVENTITPAESK